jgi:hypothetical protein
VLDAGSQLLSELSPDAMAPIFTAFTGQFSLQKEQRIRGRAIVLTTPGARGNYFHGVLSFCPKFICCSCGLFEPKKDTFLVNHDEAHYQIQTLALLGCMLRTLFAPILG